MYILTINAGSSSIKYKLFKDVQHNPQAILTGLIERIGEPSGQWQQSGLAEFKQEIGFSDHHQAYTALAKVLHELLGQAQITAVAHRVVHGGTRYWQPTRIDDQVLADLEALSVLAPIHNPVNCQGIRFAREAFPEAEQVALFDTGFHHSMPAHVYTYPIARQLAADLQIRRYGFHGINHHYVAEQAAAFLNKPLAQCQLISLHLGNGASACLIRDGQSFDTSMGMTPLAGLMMGTRCGDIDPAIPLYLHQQGLEWAQIDRLLNKESGLLGMADDNDMRQLCARRQAGDEAARLAIAMYVYCIQKTIGAYLSQCPKLDALIFTGGVGENASLIRQLVLADLQHLGFQVDDGLNNQADKPGSFQINRQGYPILIIKGNEELMMARATDQLIGDAERT